MDILKSYDKPRCMEWGCGGSTIYFSELAGEWIALEALPHWHDKIAKLAPKATMHLFDQGLSFYKEPQYQDALKSLCLGEYVDWPLSQGKFDFILVDGRKRSRCIAVAKKVIAKGGVIVLHDAQTEHYQDACKGLDIVCHEDELGEHLYEMTMPAKKQKPKPAEQSNATI